MPREEYQERLDELRDDVVRMGNVVSTRLQKTIAALETYDQSIATRIAETDHEINELYLDLEQDCIDLFALQQPVAGDLRFIAASFKIITDLERIADLAANLAASIRSAETGLFSEIAISDLAEITVEMLDDAIAAYAKDDAEACFAVAERDEDLDGRCERAAQQIIRTLVDETPSNDELELLLESVTSVLLTIRDLERIGDHAVNIAARTLYMVENDDALIY
ncbi:phosphate signaling complex protein PhoU [Halorientalis brevis]|uniref:Phosphate-specific transport system accessory protein PhoU n=1 Tax=Halorientalis brevis TaxID=1126241 RepID=A0ABD6C6F1_9EURY